jgi:hypothetical protein
MKYCVNVSCKMIDPMITRFLVRTGCKFNMESIFGGVRLISEGVKVDIFGKEMAKSENLEIKKFSEIRDVLIA